MARLLASGVQVYTRETTTTRRGCARSTTRRRCCSSAGRSCRPTSGRWRSLGPAGCRPTGGRWAAEMSGGLAGNRVTVVSGLARGVDAIAHESALEAGGRTIAVQACGLDMVYRRSTLGWPSASPRTGRWSRNSRWARRRGPTTPAPQPDHLRTDAGHAGRRGSGGQRRPAHRELGQRAEPRGLRRAGRITSPTSKATNNLIQQAWPSW